MKTKENDKFKKQQYLDEALKQCKCLEDFEEVIELWKTHGGD